MRRVRSRDFSLREGVTEHQGDGRVGAGGKGAEGLSDIGGACSADEGQDEIPADGDGLRSSTGANLGVVFPEGHVAHVM